MSSGMVNLPKTVTHFQCNTLS